MNRKHRVLAVMVMLVFAVSCDDDGGDGGGGGTGQCPDLSGTWLIADHCEEGAQGQTMTLSQDGCTVTEVDSGWSGPVTSEGEVIWYNPGDEGPDRCDGTLSGKTISLDCIPGDCHVELTRQ